MDQLPVERGRTVRIFLYYSLMIACGITTFIGLQSMGEGLIAPPAPAGAGTILAASPAHMNILMQVLLAMLVIIVVARGMGHIFKWIGQPAVIGEVVGGIFLGPSLLGRFAPEAAGLAFPPSVSPFLAIIAQLGVILYMFMVGLELDLKLIRRSGHATLAISHASILAPFLLGATMALWLYPILSYDSVSFTVFSLFLGVSLSVTAFPVLARILTDQRIHKSPMGSVCLACAAVDDATAWCLLALVVSIATSQPSDAVATVAMTIAYGALVLVVARPIAERLVMKWEASARVSQSAQAAVLIAMLASALATEFIGIHAIFGAFLLGTIIPHQTRLARELRRRLEDTTTVLFLPAFFAYTGLRTQIGLLSGWEAWAICGVIIAVACVGKFGGTLLAARLVGIGWRDSSALGILMNTRGLVELIVLNIGLDLGVISPKLFAMLVIMALVTTMTTTPILNLILHRHPWAVDDDVESDAETSTFGREPGGALVAPQGAP